MRVRFWRFTYLLTICFMLVLCCGIASAQDIAETDSIQDDPFAITPDEEFLPIKNDTVTTVLPPVKAENFVTAPTRPIKIKRDWSKWRPEAKRAMWMSIILPGAGQIYNRKYWKLPIFYGGFVGCAYALSWNNQMYQDYAQAYKDIMDDDDETHSYDQFMHLGNQIDASNISRYQDLFRKRKDRFRRYRDMSIFCIIGVYALSIVDAYVDASLSEFDISDDLSIRIEPKYINSNMNSNPLQNGAWGVQCSLNF